MISSLHLARYPARRPRWQRWRVLLILVSFAERHPDKMSDCMCIAFSIDDSDEDTPILRQSNLMLKAFTHKQ